MSYDWNDLAAALNAADVILFAAIPTSENVDLVLWPDDDAGAWLTTATQLGVRIVYAEEVRLSDRISLVRDALEHAKLTDDAFEAEALALDLELANLEASWPNTPVGWHGEWRVGGVAHAIEVLDVPAELMHIAERVDDRIPAVRDSKDVRAANWHLQWEADQQKLLERVEAAAAVLAAHPDFPGCRNMGTRKALLMKLGLDLAGLNKEEIIQLARQKFDDESGAPT